MRIRTASRKAARAGSHVRERHPSFGVLLLCFLLSGATALVYEVVWLRMLGLVFGHTVYAITTVLAAFMAGLGLGSVLFGRRAARFSDPIRAYGLLEISIGLSCSLMPLFVWLASFIYLGLYRVLGTSYQMFGLIQFVLLFALLLVPTTLMGGTLPVLSQALVRREDGMARTVGALYAVNTFGAVAGVILAGYALLPEVGNRNTLWIAAAANVAVGLVAIAYSRSLRATEPRSARRAGSLPASPVAAAAGINGLGSWLVAAALGVSGAVSMIYEVAWTRGLTLVIGSSTYAFTAMLTAFLVGIAGGAALYSLWWGTRRATPIAFALIQGGIGVAAAVVLLAFDRLPEMFLRALGQSLSPAAVEVAQILVSALALLPTTLLIGATFPCAVAACARAPARIAEDVGGLYGVNTLGAIVGAVLAGFVLVPALGVHASVQVGIVTNLVLAALLCVPWLDWRWGVRSASLAAASLATVAAVTVLPAWDKRVMSTGPAIYAQDYLARLNTAGASALPLPDQLLFYRDGPSATVAVTQVGDRITLRVNGKSDASTNPADMPTQLNLAHLPLLLHPDPRSVLVIGLGSGITAGAAARHPLERLDVVEIEPAVVEAARFFAQYNGDVFKDPRFRLTIADGRNYLLTTKQRYDVIISEPSNPWIGGIASLFSVEFFELARRRLQPGGMMVQWLQAYSLSPEDFQMVVKTFGSAFPATSVWHSTRGDYLRLGRMEPAPVDLALLKARYGANPALRRDLELAEVTDWPGVLGYFMLGERDADRYAAGAAVNTDDRLPLEFSAPRALYVDTVIANWSLMKRFKVAEFPDLTPESRRDLESAPARHTIGMVYLSRGVLSEAYAQFQRALALDPNYTPAQLGSGTIFVRAGRYSEALALAERVLAREPRNVEALLVAGLASTGLAAGAPAKTFFDRALALQPQTEIQRIVKKLAPDGISPGR